MDEYIEEIKSEITKKKYLENGMAEDIGVYFGKESLDTDFPLTNGVMDQFHKIDLGNMGIPVYMRKSNFIPSNYHFPWHLRVRFFMEDPIKENIKELEEMRIGREAALSYQLK